MKKVLILFVVMIMPVFLFARPPVIAHTCGCIRNVMPEDAESLEGQMECVEIYADGRFRLYTNEKIFYDLSEKGDKAIIDSKDKRTYETCAKGDNYCNAKNLNKKCLDFAKKDTKIYQDEIDKERDKRDPKKTKNVVKLNLMLSGCGINKSKDPAVPEGAYKLSCSLTNTAARPVTGAFEIHYDNEKASCYGYNKLMGDLGLAPDPKVCKL